MENIDETLQQIQSQLNHIQPSQNPIVSPNLYIQWTRSYFFFYALFLFLFIFLWILRPDAVTVVDPTTKKRHTSFYRLFFTTLIVYLIVLGLWFTHSYLGRTR